MMRKERCDWRGDVLASFKEADTLGGWSIQLPDGRIEIIQPEATVTLGDGGEILVDGDPIPEGTQVTALLQEGLEWTTYQGCAKKMGHKGPHGNPEPFWTAKRLMVAAYMIRSVVVVVGLRVAWLLGADGASDNWRFPLIAVLGLVLGFTDGMIERSYRGD